MNEPADTDGPALVLAQQGTQDNRALQILDPVVTLQELHGKLWVSSNGGKQQATSLSTALPGSRCRPGPGSAHSARSAQSSTTRAARPVTALHPKVELSDYVNPMLWAAALQQEAIMGPDRAVPPNPKLTAVMGLQAAVMREVQQYRQLAPQLQVHQQQHPYLRPVRKLPQSFMQQQLAAEAAQASAQGVQTHGLDTQAAASTAAVAAAEVPPLQQLASLTRRLEAACQHVIQDLPEQPPADTGTATPTSTSTRHVQHHSRLHTHRSTPARTPKTPHAHGHPHPSGHGPSFQVHQQPQGRGHAADSARPSMLVVDSSSAVSCSTPVTCKTHVGSSARACDTPGQSPQLQHAAVAWGQKQQQSPHKLLQQLQPPDFAHTPFKLQHLRLEVCSGSSSPRSGGSRAGKSGASTGRAQGITPATGPTSIEALKAQLPADSADALAAATAASVGQHLQRYHTHMLKAQQQLLADEWGEGQAQQGPRLCGASTAACCTQQLCSNSVASSAAGSGGGLAGAAAAGCSSSAELTMQELVARLVQQDVRQDDSNLAKDSRDDMPCSATAAVNHRVATATSLSELISAANEHLKLAAQGSSIKLDIGRIARLHRMGKQWLSETSARSNSSSACASSRTGDATAPSTSRPAHTGANSSSSSDSSMASDSCCSSAQPSAREVRPVVPRPLPPGSGAASAAAAAQAAAAARSSAACSSGRNSSDAATTRDARLFDGVSRGAAAEATDTGVPRRASCLCSQQASTYTVTSVTSTSSLQTAGAAPGLSSAHPTESTRSSHSHESSSSRSRLPPPMKVSAPLLQPPTEAELAALPMPSLPPLLDLSHEPVKVLQARLERVWEALGTPAQEQLDMVLRYTCCSAAAKFEAVLEAWETAAAAVLQREALLEQLLHIKAAIMDCSRQPEQLQQQHTDKASAEALSTCRSQLLLIGLTMQQVRQVLWAFLAATQQAQQAADDLEVAAGQQLLVDGSPYPPQDDDVSAELQGILTEAWQLLDGSHAIA